METIDIIKEMRGTRPDCDDCLSNHTCEYLIRFADRLDAAYKRDLQSMVDAGEIDMRTAMDEVTKLREENARLKEALACVFHCADSTCGFMSICWTCPVAQHLGGAV